MKELSKSNTKKNIWLYVFYILPTVFLSAFAIGYTSHYIYDFVLKIIG